MILRHIAKKKYLEAITNDGYLKSLKCDGKEKNYLYFEEYKGNDYLLEYILSDHSNQNLSKEDFVSFFFCSDALSKNGIKIKKSDLYTKSETAIGIENGSITEEQQSRIGEYYIVINQVVPLELST